MKKTIWLFTFSLLTMSLLIQFFEAGSFRASGSDSSYQLMINDVDTYVVPDTPNINISTVEVDDDETYIYFRLNITGSVNTTHWYGIDLDYDQDGVEDHTLQLYDGEFEWDWSIQLVNSSFSGSFIVWVAPKWLETDSNFTMQAFAYNRLTWSSDYAPGDVGEWSSPYLWQVGEGIVEPYLTGVYLDYGLDLDDDGKFECLAIDVEINATVAGNYSVTVDGLTNSTHEIPVWNTTDSGYLSEGVYSITVLLSGPNIFSSGINGPYTLVQVVLECYPYSDLEDSPYTTAFYDYRQFSAPPACFMDTYSDAGVDLDGDGKFEYLVFTIGVNVTVGGTYRVALMDLLDSLGNTIDVWDSTTLDLEPGVQNVSVHISGPKLFSSEANGPYTILYLHLEDSAFNLLDSRETPYTTVNAYSYTDFEEPAIITNDILKVLIEDILGGEGIGVFTIKTGVGHPNPGENVFFGGAAEDPWSSFTTIRVEDALKEYVTSTHSKTPSSGYTVEYLDDYSPIVTRISDTRATISWTTAENLLVTLLIDIRGTTLADTMVQVTMTIQNDDTNEHSVAVRYEWDLMIDGEDDSWIRVWTDPSAPESWTETETDWVSPTFQFWETTNNPAAPVFSIYGSTVLPLASPPPTIPDRLVYASWAACHGTAYDFTPSGGSGMDSAVLYYWNAEDISPGEQISRTAYVTTVVGAELAAFAWSTDSAGNLKSTFDPSDNAYVKGRDFPPNTDITIYLIPDAEDALPANAIASVSTTTDTTGDLPVTLVWSQPLTTGEYDIWVDLNQNQEFDAGDVWNNQVGRIYPFSVIPPGPVVPDATKPVADAGPDQTINEDNPTTLDGSASSDNVGITVYTWTFTDITTMTLHGEKPAYTFNTPGVYTITVNVTDAAGNWATDTVVITVLDVTKPVADADIDQTAVEDNVMSFDAEGSSDNVGIVSYEWDFGDGNTGTGLTVNHTYAEPGTYNPTLTVRDAAGNEGTHSFTITVLHAEVKRDETIREPRSVYIVAAVAVAGAAATAATAALGSFGGLGQSFNSAVSRLPIPDRLKDFLQLYGEKMFETVDKAKLEALEKAHFITKGDVVAFGISALIMTIVFGYVEANGLPHFLNPSVLATVIPSTLLSACLVNIAEEISEALCARTCRVYRQYRLWLYGLGAFLISGFLFLFPFASPGITRYQSGEISNKTKGLIVLSKMLMLLTLTIPFAGLFMLGFKIIGDAGLLLTLMTVCYSLVPLKPLAGKAVFDYRKEVSLVALVSVAILFYSWTVDLLPHVIYLAVGLVSVFLAAITLSQLRRTHPK